MRRVLAALAAAVLISALLGAGSAQAGTVTMQACATAGVSLGPAWTTAGTAPISEVDNCSSGGLVLIDAPTGSDIPDNDYGQWSTTLPSGLNLISGSVPAEASLINPNGTTGFDGTSGFNVRYLWGGGGIVVHDSGTNCCGGMDYASPFSQAIGGQYFIVQVACTLSECKLPDGGSTNLFDFKDLTLTAEDDVPPTISVPASVGDGANLWSAGAWLRGSFGLAFTADNSAGSGVCNVNAYINGQTLRGSAAQDSVANSTLWQQCPGSAGYSDTVDTTTYPNGPVTVALDAIDAASPVNHAAPTSESIGIDNEPVTLNLSGASDVPSNGGTTYVTATATAGPSGVKGITCSVDGGSATFYSGASAQIPVSGLGSHQASCYAQNNAVNAAGQPAQSSTQIFSIALRQPTASVVSFGKLVDRERCTTTTKREHHHRTKVRTCRPRTITRKITITKVVKRHGKKVRVKRTKVVHLPQAPHLVSESKLRVRYGRKATVSGVLSVSGGGLGGQSVAILAAPNNGTGQYAQIASATTSATGAWTATIPAGPSRLIEASYAGSGTTEPATSAPITLTVPAKIRITSIRPSHVAWGSTIKISGELFGGYLPPVGALVELDYTYGHATTVYGVKTHITTKRFSTSFTFGPGDRPVVFGFQAATLPTGDYPFASSSSNTRDVSVGGISKTSSPPARRRKHHKAKTHHHNHSKK
jgi:hypothetical protein